MKRIGDSKDFFSGLIFILFGCFAALGAREYPMGNAARMGPGYFPTVLGGLLAFFGVVISVRGMLRINGESIHGLAFRPLLLVLSGVVAFAFLIERVGVVIAILAMIFLSSLGGEKFRFREATLLFLVLAALSVGIFSYGLHLPFKVWPI